MATKLVRCIRTNDNGVIVLTPDDGREIASPIVIAPEPTPVIGPDGAPELWYWDADPNQPDVVA